MLKAKFNILVAFGTVGLVTSILVFGAAVNCFINYASAQQQQQFTAKL
jgi:hypothetical protein